MKKKVPRRKRDQIATGGKLIRRLSDKLGFTTQSLNVLLKNIFDTMVELLIEKEALYLKHFGFFRISHLKTREIFFRNEKIIAPERYKILFREGQYIKKLLKDKKNSEQINK